MEPNPNTSESCRVSSPMRGNHATSCQINDIDNATGVQPSSLKALAMAVLWRNRACNQSAIVKKDQCNFHIQSGAKKLHRGPLSSLVEASEKSESAKPGIICFSCKGSDFWISVYGVCVCRCCHPPATPQLEVTSPPVDSQRGKS